MNLLTYNNQVFQIKEVLHYELKISKNKTEQSIFNFNFIMQDSAENIYNLIKENIQNNNFFLLNKQKFYIEEFYYSTNNNQLILKGVIKDELL